ncbi:MAG: ATP-binding cassette domain-containing protein [Clostridia bacterium]|jgi:ABC-2 type transport system ATP-binding protein|nr:ATP-binding cassette domain-containing protein [Clostridia bacterium]
MSNTVLETINLTKKYKKFIALDNASITIKKSDIYGLIGRNGAGKTTLMKVITTLTNKTSGEFKLFDSSDSELTESKRRIGCLIENPAFFPNMSAYKNLKYYAIQKGIIDEKQIDEALKLVNLNEVKNKKFKTFSLGMKQRLGIALAILDNPDFIILDEPINGLDPIGISDLRETFKKLNEERDITILISSHILSELYAVATKFCIIEKGKVIKELTKEELDLECSKCIVIKTDNVKKAATVLEKELKTTNYKVIDDKEIRLYDYLEQSNSVNKSLIKNDVNVMSIAETGISLEDYFKEVIKEEK